VEDRSRHEDQRHKRTSFVDNLVWRTIKLNDEAEQSLRQRTKWEESLTSWTSCIDTLPRRQLYTRTADVKWSRLILELSTTFLLRVISTRSTTATKSSWRQVSQRGHAFKLYSHVSRVDVRTFFYSQRFINPWNGLPAKSEHLASLKNFKRFIHIVEYCSPVWSSTAVG